ncbi:hypothetical protein [Paenibacillus sp. A3]|nr:hypothetical protein [Paenibacillus sp. A3]
MKTKKKEDVVELLKKAEKKGYVFEEANGWVAFVCNGNQMS